MTAGGAETLTPPEPEAWDEGLKWGAQMAQYAPIYSSTLLHSGPVEPEIIIGPGPEQCSI